MYCIQSFIGSRRTAESELGRLTPPDCRPPAEQFTWELKEDQTMAVIKIQWILWNTHISPLSVVFIQSKINLFFGFGCINSKRKSQRDNNFTFPLIPAFEDRIISSREENTV